MLVTMHKQVQSMCIRMRLCVYVCVFVCVHMCLYLCVCVCLYLCVCLCVLGQVHNW